MIKIGYQGIEGSNSEEAAKNMVHRLGIKDYELVPLVNSMPVIGSLKRREIDYGVIAIKNTLGGVVEESFNAIKNEYLELVSTEILSIHHSLFKKSADINNDEIIKVVSHVQALKQTQNNLQKILPNVEVEEIEDTAIGAKRLANGELEDNVAVICRKNAGESFGLELISENIEDKSDNYTEFRMFKLSTIDYENNEKPTLIDKIIAEAVNDRGLGHISKVIFVIAIFLGFYINEQLNWTAWEVATTIGGFLSAIFLFLTSSTLQDKVRHSYIKGYWKYYSIPESREFKDVNQSYEIPRIVEISEVDDKLVFTGWISDLDNVVFFTSDKIMLTDMGKQSGTLLYWYSSPSEAGRHQVGGLVELNWRTRYLGSKINRMSGWYTGRVTKEIGNVEYLRITEEEFNTMKSSDFLP